MAATRLTDSQKSELVARYRSGEGSSELAVAYGCSVHTVSRAVKAALPPEEYDRLKQERARGGRPALAAPAQGEGQQLQADAGAVDPEPSTSSPPLQSDPEEVSGPDASDARGAREQPEEPADDAEGSLAIDDADDFDEDGGADDGEDEDLDDDADGIDDAPAAGVAIGTTQAPVSCIPLAEAELPASVYMLVEKTVELEARPLHQISELGPLPPGEEERQALQLFVNPRNAKRLCGRNQRVIKIPDTRIFERTATYLIAQGISRVVIENGLYSLPGA